MGFIRHKEAHGVSVGRLYKYAWELFDLKELLPIPFRKANRASIENLVRKIGSAELNGKPRWSGETKSDLKKALKTFYKYVRYGNADKLTPFPKEVAWIETSVPLHEQKEVVPLDELKMQAIIDQAPTVMEKAYYGVISELGMRPGECLSLKVGNVSFTNKGIEIHLDEGKTGPRTIRMAIYGPLVEEYWKTHPQKDNPEASLWFEYTPKKGWHPYTYGVALAHLKKTAQLAGIKENVNLKLFRHSAASRDANFNISEDFLRAKFGWSKSSRTPARYKHFKDQQAMNDTMGAIYAKEEIKAPEPKVKSIKCPRCRKVNPPGTNYCLNCMAPLKPGELALSMVPEVGDERIKKLEKEVKFLRYTMHAYKDAFETAREWIETMERVVSPDQLQGLVEKMRAQVEKDDKERMKEWTSKVNDHEEARPPIPRPSMTEEERSRFRKAVASLPSRRDREREIAARKEVEAETTKRIDEALDHVFKKKEDED